MSITISPRANIKPPKAYLLLLSIFLPPLAFPGFTGMVKSLGAGGTYYLLWGREVGFIASKEMLNHKEFRHRQL